MRQLLTLLLTFGILCGMLGAQQLEPRRPIPKTPVRALPAAERLPNAGLWQDDLVVKFVDAARVRARGDGTLASEAGADLSALGAVILAHGMSFEPLIQLPQSRLQALEARARMRSGTEQPDLAGLMRVRLPEPAIPRLEAAGEALAAIQVVEFASIHTLGAPPPGDIAPPTPSHVALQTYRGPDPGMDADAALALGLNGTGIRIYDCEYGWVASHEDLNTINLHPEPGQTVHPSVASLGYDEHGTAVMGELAAAHNGYGCSGMAAGAEVHTYTEWSVQQGLRRLTCITNAIADARAGDVVLLEMQTGAGAPAEADPAVWMVVKAGTDAGVVVVGAAGNGNQNLDSAGYAAYMALGNSGAIIVGAGSNTMAHNKLSFSTYGARVNVQGWGTTVFTIGYGDFAQYGGDKNQRYTAGFNGTSSASPFVAAACLLLQQRAQELYTQPLEPTELRQVLIDSGLPQGSGGHIGPFVSMPAAIGLVPPRFLDLGSALSGTSGPPNFAGQGSLQAAAPVVLSLSNARPTASAWLVIGGTAVNAPFKGGTLVPAADLLIGPLLTDGGGQATFVDATPPGLPSGAEIFLQWWIDDRAAVKGWAASNALRATTP